MLHYEDIDNHELPLTRVEIDRMVRDCRGGKPGGPNEHFLLRPSCHEGSGFRVRYMIATGELVFICQECKAERIRIKVAAGHVE